MFYDVGRYDLVPNSVPSTGDAFVPPSTTSPTDGVPLLVSPRDFTNFEFRAVVAILPVESSNL